MNLKVPKGYRHFQDLWQAERYSLLSPYRDGSQSFVANLLPELAVRLTAAETLDILRARMGPALDEALRHIDPLRPAPVLPGALRGPADGRPDGTWLKTTNMVGINVRTVGTFWNVVKYALTLPQAQDSIHLLPIWEPGVVGSLYGMSSWQINGEFFSHELALACPHLDTVERQLKLVVNLLHAMGKAVGMDVIPHTDRFSEIVLCYPHYFEWLQRQGTEIVDHSANLHLAVQECILGFLGKHGPAVPHETLPAMAHELFSAAYPEARRRSILLGTPDDRDGREARRLQLVGHLYDYGFEPVPATMAPPYRGLAVNPNARTVDSMGHTWYDYAIVKPEAMSRVFGPLTRYKLYEPLDDNAGWQIDFASPRREVWDYLCEHYYDVQCRYGFDFMRGDMSHVQMRPGGVPCAIDDYYDPLRAVKSYIQKEKGVRHFGYFAETFLAGRNTMLYGDEVDHLEACDADTTLGDLQSTAVGSPQFLQRLGHYHNLRTTRTVAPNLTVITGDKDDPRFDEYYLRGSALRLFIGLFVADMPSYMALGFEARDVHHQPAPNEHYTKLYVFHEETGPKATHGPYTWGHNGALFHDVTRLRLYAEGMLAGIQGRPTRWLIHPDASGEARHIAWTQADSRPAYLFVANTDTLQALDNVNLPLVPGLEPGARLALDFSTADRVPDQDRQPEMCGTGYKVWHLAPGEGRVYRFVGTDEG